VLALPITAVLGTGALGWHLQMDTRADLIHQSALLGLHVRDSLAVQRVTQPGATVSALEPRLSATLADARAQTLAGFRVLDADGIVRVTSGDGLGDDLSAEPEIARALAGQTGFHTRERARPEPQPLSSPSRRARVRLFVAQPVELDGERVGVVLAMRTPVEEVQALYRMAPRMIWGIVVIIVLTLALTGWYGVRFSRSLRALLGVTQRISRGETRAASGLLDSADSRVIEIRELADAIGSMTARLQARLGYIREFAGNVSHEFKTPLSTLRGTVELLHDEPDMAPTDREMFLDNAIQDLDRMERLVSGLLDLAHAEEATAHAPVALGALLESASRRFPGAAVSGRCGRVRGDRRQLELALDNLMENAARHGGERVRLVGWTAPTRTGFDVIDDGPGISPANRAQVFDRFFTTNRESGGTGLGLALVAAVCRAHGGEVSVESAPGRTCFRLALPRIAEPLR